ncbi:ABC transporter permease subunit [Sporomusa sp.]|jgi:simple sugar transport system permease protein|uniref:ABC transporter permease subunit n=1 Tax=Sporomusa sp. TaxID=2078658 RepID=UPI002BE695E0|nr:ABC transporter permease [Sporomusa sp.]HWR09482.1 ABC transporter permease [Sporomusa sp.]
MNTGLVTQAKQVFSIDWLKNFLRANTVPLIFLALCIATTIASELPLKFVINELVVRLSRNLFLVIALIIPVLAGMGLNFALVIGAMAGQIGLIAVKIWDIGGLAGFTASVLVATPFAVLFGYLTGITLNKTKGREMITSMILGFFANGLWQLVFLLFIGTLIPIYNPEIVLKSGVGLKNAIDLKFIQYSLDKLLYFKIGGITIPVVTFLTVIALAWFTRFIVTTKIGQDFRALGQDLHIAQVAGIPTDKIRLIAITISTILAAWGQIIFLQNIGTLNTYNSHEQVGMFAIAALLIGGATVAKATISDAVIGTLLFHTLFIVSPQAGNNLFGDAQIGEFFRVFIAYGIIGVSLLLHAWHKYMENKRKSMLE